MDKEYKILKECLQKSEYLSNFYKSMKEEYKHLLMDYNFRTQHIRGIADSLYFAMLEVTKKDE